MQFYRQPHYAVFWHLKMMLMGMQYKSKDQPKPAIKNA